MFGSRIVSTVIYQTLSQALVGLLPADQIVKGYRYPAETPFPAVLFYMESAAYDAGQAVGAEHITAESMRFTVRVDDENTTDERIYPIAMAQLQALAGLRITTADGHSLTFHANGELPITNDYDGDQEYQRLGTTYDVTVTFGG